MFSTICFLLSCDIGSKCIAEYIFSEIFTQPLMYGHTNTRSVVTEIDISVTNSDCKIFLQCCVGSSRDCVGSDYTVTRLPCPCAQFIKSQVSSVSAMVFTPTKANNRVFWSREDKKKKSSAWNQLYTKVNGKESLNSPDEPSFTGLREDNRV